MAEDKLRKKKPVKKKPTEQNKKRLFGGSKKEDTKPKDQAQKKQKEDTVAGNGQVLQSKGALLGKIGAWLFVVFVAFGAVAAILNLINPPATAEQVVESGDTPESQQAAEYARGYVGAWLRATSDNDQEIARYSTISRGDITEDEPTRFRELSVASVETDDSGLSTVIVSAEIYTIVEDEAAATEDEEAEEDGAEDSSTGPATSEDSDDEGEETSDDEASGSSDEDIEEIWVPTWYQVNVFYDPNAKTFAPTGWPAPVPAPETGNGPRMAYNFAGSDEIESTIDDFFKAYVLEAGDVTRLTHPESTIQPLGPNPYTAVAIDTVTTDEDHRDEVPEDGTTTRALVHLDLGTTEDTSRRATYALTLETRGGRWEVRNLDPAPVLHSEVTVQRESEPTDTAPEEDAGADNTSDNDGSSE